MECNKPNAKKNELPEIVDVEKNLNDELLKYFKGEKNGYVQVGPKKWFLPMKYKKMAQDIIDFEVRPDDVWVMGIPRSGTTVIQELAWLLRNDLNFEEAKKDLIRRVPFFEHNLVFNELSIEERLKTHPDDMLYLKMIANIFNLLGKKEGRRVMKTHLPFDLLPPDILNKGCKVIYICRHPKDVAYSYYSLQRTLWQINYVGDFSKYWSFYKNGNSMFGPYFEHVKQGYEKRNSKNIFFLFYEDYRKDSQTYIEKIARFLERPVNETELKQLVEYLDFQNFKQNKNKTSGFKDVDNKEVVFARKGKVGDGKDHFTEEMNKDADEWIEKNTMELGIEFPK